MKPTELKDRMNLDEEAIFEDDVQAEEAMSDEDLKIESLKIATNIAKLMSNVTTEDIVNIAETVAKFIKGGDNTALETTENTEEDTEETEEDTEESEDFETDETSDNDNEDFAV